jgi:hypothetical protein
MGNKDKGKREVKKKPQAKPKPAPGRVRENFTQTAARIAGETTDKV